MAERPLDPVYPVVFFDALRVKIRDEGLVKNKAVYVALALNPDGEKDVLGLWIEQSEGAKFWLKVVNELKARGVNDILIAVVDGLKGFPEAITSVFPQTVVQTCIVHLIRNSLAFVSWKDRKALLPSLKRPNCRQDRTCRRYASPLKVLRTAVSSKTWRPVRGFLPMRARVAPMLARSAAVTRIAHWRK
jgi:transposase-like protein